jgi:hypothetical protein
MHHGESRREDMKLINSRVVGENLALPSFEELQGNDVSYACYTNTDRNLISDNIFATILEKHHLKEHETFEIPEQTITSQRFVAQVSLTQMSICELLSEGP